MSKRSARQPARNRRNSGHDENSKIVDYDRALRARELDVGQEITPTELPSLAADEVVNDLQNRIRGQRRH